MANNETRTLILKCVDFYINSITDTGTKCPTVEHMREIVKLEDIKASLDKKAEKPENPE